MFGEHTNPAFNKIRKTNLLKGQNKENLFMISKTQQTNYTDAQSKLVESKVINKSHSGLTIGNIRHVQQMEKQNDEIRKRIGETKVKIKEVEHKSEVIASKFRKLKEDQSNKLQVQIRRLNLEDKNTDFSGDWGSQLSCSSLNGKSESRMKLSDIREKMNRIDLSCVSRLVFEKVEKIKDK